jgi:hypothetical protein
MVPWVSGDLTGDGLEAFSLERLRPPPEGDVGDFGSLGLLKIDLLISSLTFKSLF